MKPQIMGILNITPDSFYDGGKFLDTQKAYIQAQSMIGQGVDIIDIGGFSSRPGSKLPSVQEELDRILPVLDRLQNLDIPISIDTCRAEIVGEVLKYKNVKYINDISGLSDLDILALLSDRPDVSYVLMHTQGTPENMQDSPCYGDVVSEISEFFEEKISLLQQAGVHNIIIDPGIGFGKTVEHNYSILKYVADFKKFELPLFVGVSRKSLLYKRFDTTPDKVLPETVALGMYLMQQGVDILRVHDVQEHVHVREIHTTYLL